MIVYPTENYNSFISVADADTYFDDRLNAGPWDGATSKEAALVTAYRSLADELSIVIDLSDADQFQAIRQAQCEQALWELENNLSGQALSGLTLGGLLSVKIPSDKTPPARYSPRTLALLRPYLRGRSITRTR